MKQFFTFVIACLLLVSLTACGNTGDNPVENSNASEDSGKVTSSDSSEAVSKEQTKENTPSQPPVTRGNLVLMEDFDPSYRPPAKEESAPDMPSEPADSESESLDYILNLNSKKFHKPDCASVEIMKESNKQPFHGTREEAIANGYDPCENCNP